MDHSPDHPEQVRQSDGPETTGVQPDQLRKLLSERRRRDRLSLEQVARITGVSAATLSRWERGRTDGDPHKLHAVARWLGVQLDPASVPTPLLMNDPVTHHEGQDTVDFIEAHLRADPNLDPKTAGALARMIKAAYEQFAPRPTNAPEHTDE
jgi:transcriptional regulator with XRE-family HTH domain